MALSQNTLSNQPSASRVETCMEQWDMTQGSEFKTSHVIV